MFFLWSPSIKLWLWHKSSTSGTCSGVCPRQSASTIASKWGSTTTGTSSPTSSTFYTTSRRSSRCKKGAKGKQPTSKYIPSKAKNTIRDAEVIVECLVEEERQKTQALSVEDKDQFFQENPNFVSEIAARRAKGIYLPNDKAWIATYYKWYMTNLERELQKEFIGRKSKIPPGPLEVVIVACAPPPTSQARKQLDHQTMGTKNTCSSSHFRKLSTFPTYIRRSPLFFLYKQQTRIPIDKGNNHQRTYFGTSAYISCPKESQLQVVFP